MYLLQNVNLIYFLFIACAVSQWTNTGRRYALIFIIYTATFGNKQTRLYVSELSAKKKKINLYYGLLSFARGVKKIFFLSCVQVFREKIDYYYCIPGEECVMGKRCAVLMDGVPTSFEFWKTAGSKTKSGYIKAVKPQDKVIKNVPFGQVV